MIVLTYFHAEIVACPFKGQKQLIEALMVAKPGKQINSSIFYKIIESNFRLGKKNRKLPILKGDGTNFLSRVILDYSGIFTNKMIGLRAHIT